MKILVACERDSSPVERFGRMVVMRTHRAAGRIVADCLCDCGSTKTVRMADLRYGGIQSCGCLKRETSRMTGLANRRHGASASGRRTTTYRSWESMKSRCLNPDDHAYNDYGGRGIFICQQWQESFESFLIDMGERPKGTTIDRIDVNDGYYPGNCRWGSPSQQGRNKRNNRMVDFNGKAVPLAVVAEQTGIPYQRLHNRISKLGWSVEDAIKKPARTFA